MGHKFDYFLGEIVENRQKDTLLPHRGKKQSVFWRKRIRPLRQIQLQ